MSSHRHTGRLPSPARTAARPAAGFTLIEVVVAVAVVAIGLAAAFGGIIRVASNTALLQEKTLASWIAHNRITELRLQPAAPEIGESDGEVEFAGQRWRWEVEVIATQVEALRRVEVRVRHDEDGQVLASAVGFVGPPIPAGAQPPSSWSGAAAVPGPGQEAPPGDGPAPGLLSPNQ